MILARNFKFLKTFCIVWRSWKMILFLECFRFPGPPFVLDNKGIIL